MYFILSKNELVNKDKSPLSKVEMNQSLDRDISPFFFSYSNDYKNIILECLQEIPSKRPTSEELLKRIKILSEKLDEMNESLESIEKKTNIPKNVETFLGSVELQKYTSMFKNYGFDSSESLYFLSKQDLRDLKIPFGHIKKIMDEKGKYSFNNFVIDLGSLNAFFESLFLEEYVSLFEDEGYDMESLFQDIKEMDLKELGITKEGHLSRILLAVETYRNNEIELFTPSTSPEMPLINLESSSDLSFVASSPLYSPRGDGSLSKSSIIFRNSISLSQSLTSPRKFQFNENSKLSEFLEHLNIESFIFEENGIHDLETLKLFDKNELSKLGVKKGKISKILKYLDIEFKEEKIHSLNLKSLLETIRMDEYYPIFEREFFDLESFSFLDEVDLNELGIIKIGHVKKLKKYMKLIEMEEREEIFDSISNWLNSFGLAEYETIFKDEQITLDQIPDLTEEEIKNDLGIQKYGHLKKMMRNIKRLKF
jgi:hypothetical protein